MAVKVKIARGSRQGHPLRNAVLLGIAGLLVLFLVTCLSVFSYFSHKYKHIVDERLQKPLFVETAKIYAAPREVRMGQKLTPATIAQELRAAGYSPAGDRNRSGLGTFSLRESSIAIHPGPQSFHSEEGATVYFNGRLVTQIAGDRGQPLEAYELEPQLITGLSEDQNRTKRRLVTYDELPQNLVNAVVAIEDRRFFEHGGVDYLRLAGALRDDLRAGRRREGGSTLTMQLARGFFLSPEKRLKRKLIEIAITFQLESRFSKQQIFQMYANQINLGQQGTFAINGFGQAAQTYFGRDVRQLDLAQCALLAGMIQHPSFLNPYRHPQRAIQRRNLVLDAMTDTGRITRQQADRAKAEPLHLSAINVDAGEAPYFVDLVRDRLVQKLGDSDFNREGLRIYTSLDPDLQRAAAEAVDEGMKLVDAQVDKLHARHLKKGDTTPVVYPQVSLVALNPHTGQVLALVGGRNYGQSQLNHAVAHRPTGSIFKPFVYAAAYNTSLSGTVLAPPAAAPQNVAITEPPPPDPGRQSGIFTAVTPLNNDLTTFEGGYAPGNFHGKYTGDVTARFALQMSLNNATVELAQMVGYNNVASLARDAGIRSARGTPSVALGAYDATPLDMAGAYTVFANGGVRIEPWMVASIRAANGDVMSDFAPDTKPVLDPRVAYLTLSLMQNVINAGTGYEVRHLGFTPPAAGKTGTSHDAWFAGFTSNLLCVVWIGNDDYTDVKLQGGTTAAPLWAAFMKKAVQLPQYSDTKEFPVPPGITTVRLDKVTNLLANPTCPVNYYAAFLDGTAPSDTCDHANGDSRNLFQKLFGLGNKPPATPQTIAPQPGAPPPFGQPATPETAVVNGNPADPQQQQPKKKRGFFSRIFGGKSDDSAPPPAPPPPQEPH